MRRFAILALIVAGCAATQTAEPSAAPRAESSSPAPTETASPTSTTTAGTTPTTGPTATAMPSTPRLATPSPTGAPTPALTLPPPASAGSPIIAGCPVLPANNAWNADISGLPVHPRSAQWLASASAATKRLHPDFGADPYGYQLQIVDRATPRTSISFYYTDESDPGPYPLTASTPIEPGSDRHAFMLDRDTCVLYELFDVAWNAGSPTAGSGAIFDLRSNALRPAGWTSADAAGLPIVPGIVRYDEVAAGEIRHALRFTVQRTDRSYVWPARHQAGAANDPNLPPMGARFRLRASFGISRFSPSAQVILRAMQRYGLIVADNGSDWLFQGSTDARWGDALLSELKSIPASQFEAVDASSLMISANSGATR